MFDSSREKPDRPIPYSLRDVVSSLKLSAFANPSEIFETNFEDAFLVRWSELRESYCLLSKSEQLIVLEALYDDTVRLLSKVEALEENHSAPLSLSSALLCAKSYFGVLNHSLVTQQRGELLMEVSEEVLLRTLRDPEVEKIPLRTAVYLVEAVWGREALRYGKFHIAACNYAERVFQCQGLPREFNKESRQAIYELFANRGLTALFTSVFFGNVQFSYLLERNALDLNVGFFGPSSAERFQNLLCSDVVGETLEALSDFDRESQLRIRRELLRECLSYLGESELAGFLEQYAESLQVEKDVSYHSLVLSLDSDAFVEALDSFLLSTTQKRIALDRFSSYVFATLTPGQIDTRSEGLRKWINEELRQLGTDLKELHIQTRQLSSSEEGVPPVVSEALSQINLNKHFHEIICRLEALFAILKSADGTKFHRELVTDRDFSKNTKNVLRRLFKITGNVDQSFITPTNFSVGLINFLMDSDLVQMTKGKKWQARISKTIEKALKLHYFETASKLQLLLPRDDTDLSRFTNSAAKLLLTRTKDLDHHMSTWAHSLAKTIERVGVVRTDYERSIQMATHCYKSFRPTSSRPSLELEKSLATLADSLLRNGCDVLVPLWQLSLLVESRGSSLDLSQNQAEIRREISRAKRYIEKIMANFVAQEGNEGLNYELFDDARFLAKVVRYFQKRALNQDTEPLDVEKIRVVRYPVYEKALSVWNSPFYENDGGHLLSSHYFKKFAEEFLSESEIDAEKGRALIRYWYGLFSPERSDLLTVAKLFYRIYEKDREVSDLTQAFLLSAMTLSEDSGEVTVSNSVALDLIEDSAVEFFTRSKISHGSTKMLNGVAESFSEVLDKVELARGVPSYIPSHQVFTSLKRSLNRATRSLSDLTGVGRVIGFDGDRRH